MASHQVSKDYEMFDPWAYLDKQYGEVNAFHRHSLKLVHEFYKSYGSSPTGLKVLDFGAGPVIVYEISASLYASEIVLAEYVDKNREVLQMWLDRDPNGPNWSPFFEHVVQELEGKSKEEAAKREEELRKVVKAVIPCDIRKDPPIEPAYHGPYDAIFTGYCLETACNSLQELSAAVSKLAKLLKPGGKLVIITMEGPGDTNFYTVGDKKFVALSIREEALKTILEQNGFYDITIECQPRDAPGITLENTPPEFCDWTTKFISIATKSK